MKKAVYIIALILLAACQKEAPKVQHDALIEEVRSADKLVLAQMSVSKTIKSERDAWYKIGKRIAVYSYDNYLRAYIDMSQLSADDIVFDDQNRTVKVKLPTVQTEIIGRDMELRKEYENIGLLRSNLDSQERAEMKERANEDFLKEIDRDPHYKRQLEETARRKARQYFESLFSDYNYTAEINFRP